MQQFETTSLPNPCQATSPENAPKNVTFLAFFTDVQRLFQKTKLLALEALSVSGTFFGRWGWWSFFIRGRFYLYVPQLSELDA
jgi:hypothetical protein